MHASKSLSLSCNHRNKEAKVGKGYQRQSGYNWHGLCQVWGKLGAKCC